MRHNIPSAPLCTACLALVACDLPHLYIDAHEPLVPREDATLESSPTGWVEVLELVHGDGESPTRFAGLGDLPGGEFESYAAGVSDSGKVVGWSTGEKGTHAVRWTPETGLVALTGRTSRALAISADGRLVVGWMDAPDELEEAYEGEFTTIGVIWRAGGAPEILGGFGYWNDPYPWDVPLLDPTVVLNDGTVYGSGMQAGAYGDLIALHRDAEGDFENVGASEIFAADASGFYAGTLYPAARTNGYGSAAITAVGELGYPFDAFCEVPHSCLAAARGFSADHDVIVGTATVPPPCDDPGSYDCPRGPLMPTAFIDTASEPMRRLPDLAGGPEDSGAFAIDASGRIVVGYGTSAEGQRAVVWVDGLVRGLAEILEEAGATAAEGWSLQQVTDISPDGRILVGYGTNPSGDREGFRVVLSEAL